jgi:hypothetical protein
MPTAPRSVGGVLDDALRLYRRALTGCFPLVLGATLVMMVPGLLFATKLQLLVTGDPQAILALVRSPAIWLGCLAIAFVVLAVYGALFVQIDAIAHGKRLSAAAALGTGLRRALPTIGVGILFSLMTMTGLVLLVIPGIYLWGVYQLAFIPVVIERAGVIESLAISRRLVHGHWWHANTIFSVAFVIMYIALITIALIAALGTGFGVASAGGDFTRALVIEQLFSSVLNLLVLPFLPSILLAVYYDLKLRHAGADLASRVGAVTQHNSQEP